MTKIKSKFSIVQVLLVPLLMMALTIGLSSMILFVSFKEMNEGTPLSKTPFWAAFIMGPLGLYAFYYYLNIFRTVQIDDHGITVSNIFKSTNYQWIDIKRIKLTGKELEKFLWIGMPFEALKIEMNNGDKKIFFSKYYRNFPLILQSLQLIKKQLSKSQNPQLDGFKYKRLSYPNIRNFGTMTKYDNNHLLSFNGIAIYGFTVFMGYLVLTADRPLYPGGLFFLGLTSIFWLGLGYQLHYFLLDNEYLVIKNHIWFLRTHKYQLTDINEIVFETPHKISTSMRINTKDFHTTLYPAGSLKNSTWNHLMEELKKQKVKVRNEAIY